MTELASAIRDFAEVHFNFCSDFSIDFSTTINYRLYTTMEDNIGGRHGKVGKLGWVRGGEGSEGRGGGAR